MRYKKDKYGNELSVLGYGCMRFTSKMGKYDIDKAEKEIMTAYQNGVNYFDTAYTYPGNEALIGEIFERNNIREKINIATKLPHYLVKSSGDIERMFAQQKQRLRTDYIDYYLIHMLTDVDAWERLCGLGIKEWIESKKQSGEIKQIGFSYHGNSDMFCRIIDAYQWDFCMIQYNYMDRHSQAGEKGLRYAHEKGIPVFIMEPLRGGMLVNRLPQEAEEIFGKTNYTPAEWAFRWLFSQKEVSVVLSGMNSTKMVMQNIKTASETEEGALTSEDEKMLQRVVDAIHTKMRVGCTGCGYCVPCPKGVDIPGIFAVYNRRFTEGKIHALKDYFMCTTLRKNSTGASNCISCGKCVKHCPQSIEIPKVMKSVQKELEGPIYKIARKVAKVFTNWG